MMNDTDQLWFYLCIGLYDEATGHEDHIIERHIFSSYSEMHYFVHSLYKQGYYDISVWDCQKGCEIEWL